MQDPTRIEIYQYILNSTHDAIVAVDTDCRVLVLNPAAQRLAGATASQAIGRHLREVIPSAGLANVLATGVAELNRKQTLGENVVITNRVPVRDSQGRVVGAVAVFRDITEVKHLAEEITNLRQVQTLLSAIINAVQDAISVVDAEGNGMLINPAYTRLTGLTEKDVIGKPATVDIAEGSSMHMQVLRTGKPVKNVPMKVGPLRRQVVVSADPVMIDGELVGSVGVIRDVSEIIRLTDELDMMKRLVRRMESKYTFDEIVAESQLLTQAVDQAKRVATTSVTVLLRGESGTGKEIFAHAIHGASPRKNGPFVRVNCAALTESLLESELFGYVEGAFTGARRGGRRGLFEEAQGGTLFLDEVGVMNLPLQASLLRVLQEKEIVRVGDSKPIPVDVRVIAATNVSLEQLVAEGKFREDLYYRLNVIPIFIPPLRQRPEDIPALCSHLIRKLNQEFGRRVVGVDPKVMEAFMKHRWSGNVRELENVLGRAMINMRYHEEVITLEHLPDLVHEASLAEIPEAKGYSTLNNRKTLRQTLDVVEKRMVAAALEQCGYQKTKAAKTLGISIRSLYNKIEKHSIASPPRNRIADVRNLA